jgi:hypothetical protein
MRLSDPALTAEFLHWVVCAFLTIAQNHWPGLPPLDPAITRSLMFSRNSGLEYLVFSSDIDIFLSSILLDIVVNN